MSLFIAPAQPPSKLGRYHLSPNAGVHVLSLKLGGVSVGNKWDDVSMGTNSKEDSFKLLDAFLDDKENLSILPIFSVRDGTSEMFIGKWAEKHGIRDQLFITTKYSPNHTTCNPSIQQKILYSRTNTKALNVSLIESLKKLHTTYIDLLNVHFWDFDTSVEEVMQPLHTFILQGKVLYLGISDAPISVIAKANQCAHDHSLMLLSVYQGAWNVLEPLECDIIPMARDQGVALAPWNIFAGGKLHSNTEEEWHWQTGENGCTYVSSSWE
ncbi:NADP-dependent oxidoreductase domain-containing protein [Cyathus striatus]|nr:NADP-dependent oxidoreductase domain-containing protein [Cyathus striatus]